MVPVASAVTAIAAFLLSVPLPLRIDVICKDEQVWILAALQVAGRACSLFRWQGRGLKRPMLLGWLAGASPQKGMGCRADRLTAVLRSGRGLRVSVFIRVGSQSEVLARLVTAARGAIADVARGIVRSHLPEAREVEIGVQGEPGGEGMTISASCIGDFRIGKVILSYARG